jgi:hypothetical protein
MSLPFWLLAGGCAAAGVLIAGSRQSMAGTSPRSWPTIVGLAGLIAALLAVGVESGTPVRHVVQVSAAGLALLLAGLRSPIGRSAALPVLTVWLGLVGAIWLHLLGVVSMVRGRFTTTEVVLTIAIGAACAVGLVGGPRPTAGLSTGRRFAVGVVFAAAQLLALWASMQPAVAMR